MPKIAKEKVWLTEDRKLVKDGDPKAHELFAIKGQAIPDKRLAGVKHVEDFFHDPKHAPVTVSPEAAEKRHDKTVTVAHKR